MLEARPLLLKTAQCSVAAPQVVYVKNTIKRTYSALLFRSLQYDLLFYTHVRSRSKHANPPHHQNRSQTQARFAGADDP